MLISPPGLPEARPKPNRPQRLTRADAPAADRRSAEVAAQSAIVSVTAGGNKTPP
jgi:hypothetical protein